MSDLKENEFICYVSKELSNDETKKDLSEVAKKVQYFLGDSFEIDIVEELNNILYLTCICSSIKDFEYLSLRSSYNLSKKPLK